MATRRPSARAGLSAVVLLALVLIAAGCSSTPAGSNSGASASVSPSPAPTPALKPLAAPRPTDVPTDGACEQYQECLGLLKPGVTYRTKVFEPAISFKVPTSHWENLSDEAGILQLLDFSHPGDLIAFFRNPMAATDSGTATGVCVTVDDLEAWLNANPRLAVTPAQKTTLGGLPGIVVDAKVAATATDTGGADCPARVCVPIFIGGDSNAKPPWHWDWGFAGAVP